jgi:hypothetical protein
MQKLHGKRLMAERQVASSGSRAANVLPASTRNAAPVTVAGCNMHLGVVRLARIDNGVALAPPP